MQQLPQRLEVSALNDTICPQTHSMLRAQSCIHTTQNDLGVLGACANILNDLLNPEIPIRHHRLYQGDIKGFVSRQKRLERLARLAIAAIRPLKISQHVRDRHTSSVKGATSPRVATNRRRSAGMPAIEIIKQLHVELFPYHSRDTQQDIGLEPIIIG